MWFITFHKSNHFKNLPTICPYPPILDFSDRPPQPSPFRLPRRNSCCMRRLFPAFQGWTRSTACLRFCGCFQQLARNFLPPNFHNMSSKIKRDLRLWGGCRHNHLHWAEHAYQNRQYQAFSDEILSYSGCNLRRHSYWGYFPNIQTS